jgi:hypothetical protein
VFGGLITTLLVVMAPVGPVHLAHDIWTGSAPLDAAAVVRLQGLGVRTIVSVDALPSPEVAGVRCVHLPVGYDELPASFQASMLVVWRDCPRPIYVHCHRGHNRGPAAAVTLLRSLGRLDQEQAQSLMLQCGTSMAYPGLWRSMRSAVPISSQALSMLHAPPLQSKQQVGSIAAGMAAMDRSWSNVLRARTARFASNAATSAPVDAAAITDHLRQLKELTRKRSSQWQRGISLALEGANALEAALKRGDVDQAVLVSSWMDQHCTGCHARFRDGLSDVVVVGRPPWPTAHEDWFSPSSAQAAGP